MPTFTIGGLMIEEVWFDPQNSKLFLAFFILVLVAIAD
jgi:hypothetical protein